jgi:hypothetical protein
MQELSFLVDEEDEGLRGAAPTNRHLRLEVGVCVGKIKHEGIFYRWICPAFVAFRYLRCF